MNNPLLDSIDIHPSWLELLDAQLDALDLIWSKINNGKAYTPQRDKILRFLNLDVAKIKVVILGQDPYPQPGAATGRAFEVMGLRSWNDNFRQASLRNIVRLIHHSACGNVGSISATDMSDAVGAAGALDTFGTADAADVANTSGTYDTSGVAGASDMSGTADVSDAFAAANTFARSGERYSSYPAPFSAIRDEIRSGAFRIANPHELFERWEEQGVLLLNRHLTCEENAPGSHREIWRSFTAKVIEYVSARNEEIIWMLWGEDAKSAKDSIAVSLAENISKSSKKDISSSLTKDISSSLTKDISSSLTKDISGSLAKDISGSLAKEISGSLAKEISGSLIYECRHPMMCSPKYDDDFLLSNCFSATRNIVNWTGIDARSRQEFKAQ